MPPRDRTSSWRCSRRTWTFSKTMVPRSSRRSGLHPRLSLRNYGRLEYVVEHPSRRTVPSTDAAGSGLFGLRRDRDRPAVEDECVRHGTSLNGIELY